MKTPSRIAVVLVAAALPLLGLAFPSAVASEVPDAAASSQAPDTEGEGRREDSVFPLESEQRGSVAPTEGESDDSTAGPPVGQETLTTPNPDESAEAQEPSSDSVSLSPPDVQEATAEPSLNESATLADSDLRPRELPETAAAEGDEFSSLGEFEVSDYEASLGDPAALEHEFGPGMVMPNSGTSGVFKRLAGGSRIDTAVKIAAEMGKSERAVLASSVVYADALSAGPLAAAYRAPILLTAGKKLEPAVLAALRAQSVRKISIAGGEGSVSTAVEKSLIGAGFTVERIGGNDRFATSLALAKKAVAVSRRPINRVFVTDGMNFPDALATAAVANQAASVTVLTRGRSLPSEVKTFLKAFKGKIAVVGGAADNALKVGKVTVSERFVGNDRFATAVSIARAFPGSGTVFVASGMGAADALAGAALSASKRGVLVLTRPNTLPSSTERYLYDLGKPQATYLLGGNSSINLNVGESIHEAVTPGVLKGQTYSAGELGNMRLEVAPACYTFVTQGNLDAPKPGVLSFVNGIGKSPNDLYASVQIKEARAVKLKGRTLTAVHFQCWGGGSYVYDTLQFLDSKARRVTQLETWRRGTSYLRGMELADHYIKYFDVAGDKITVKVGGVALAGDKPIHAARKSGNAILTVRWDGKTLHKHDLWISTPSGAVKPPNLAQVQSFYRAVAEGRDTEAAPFTTAQNMWDIQNLCLSTCRRDFHKYRAALFPKDGYLEECFLANAQGRYVTKTGKWREFGYGGGGAKPGQYLCGIIRSWEKADAAAGKEVKYMAWLVVDSPRNGNFFVRVIGRAFS